MTFTPLEWLSGEFIREILTGKIPYEDLSEPQLIGSVGFDPNYRLELPEEICIEPKLKVLIERCLNREIRDRPEFEDIVRELNGIREEVKVKG